MDATPPPDLLGNPTPPPRRGRRASDLIRRRKGTTAYDRCMEEIAARQRGEPQPRRAQDKAAEKKAHRTASFYEHIAPAADSREIQWRHHHWQPKRELVRHALGATGATVQQLHNFDNCGAAAVTQWSEIAQRRRLTAFYCKCRHCEPCARAKAGKIAANLRRRLKEGKQHEFRLITLTLKHSDAPLIDQIRRLYAAFKKMRGYAGWKKTQIGGAMMLEVKWTGNAWHPHAHCVSQGRYIDKHELSAMWHKATGDSFIVDVRKIDRCEDAAHYVTKYITKSTSDSVWNDPDRAQEWVTASKSLRACATYGTWRKWPLLKIENAPTDWVTEQPLCRWIEQAQAGGLAAVTVLNSLRPHRLTDQQLVDETALEPTFHEDSG